MESKSSSCRSVLLILLCVFGAAASSLHTHNGSTFAGIDMPEHMSFNAAATGSDCGLSKAPSAQSLRDIEEYDGGGDSTSSQSVKLHLKRRSTRHAAAREESVADFAVRDLSRIQSLYTRATEQKNQNAVARLAKGRKPESGVAAPAPAPELYGGGLSGQMMATLESGVSLGSGEYFMDVFIGTPPKHFSLILDTGSDLNWIQCAPCHDCFEQSGPHYDPNESTSFKNVTCHDPRCQLVSAPDPPRPCKDDGQTCPYFYWYGDSSNTTGDFALETFTVNLTAAAGGKTQLRRVENVMFGCGHWNRGLFHGAAGLLGLGRGPLSFSSQLESLYGHSFSYCLVDRNSDATVSSKLIFGEDADLLRHPDLNFTAFVAGKENPVETFYYVEIKSILVGGDALDIPGDTWKVARDGSGGTIIDSGTTLSYFAEPANGTIKDAFRRKVTNYPLVNDIDILYPCYNVSGVEKVELPEFAIEFTDGAVWNFPVENYFISLSDDVVCLALMGTPKSALSIIGNYQQQNFHIMYDTKKSRLGYAPRRCAEV